MVTRKLARALCPALFLVLSAGCSVPVSVESPPPTSAAPSTTPAPGATAGVAPFTPAATFVNIDIREAAELITRENGNPDFIILDVRTPEEFAAGRLANAVNIDFYAAGFAGELARLAKSRAYLVYCRTGVRSAKTLDMMKQQGFREVYNMLGGITGWQSAGMLVVK